MLKWDFSPIASRPFRRPIPGSIPYFHASNSHPILVLSNLQYTIHKTPEQIAFLMVFIIHIHSQQSSSCLVVLHILLLLLMALLDWNNIVSLPLFASATINAAPASAPRSLIWINEPSPNRFQLHYNGRIHSRICWLLLLLPARSMHHISVSDPIASAALLRPSFFTSSPSSSSALSPATAFTLLPIPGSTHVH